MENKTESKLTPLPNIRQKYVDSKSSLTYESWLETELSQQYTPSSNSLQGMREKFYKEYGKNIKAIMADGETIFNFFAPFLSQPIEEKTKLVCSQSEKCEGCNGIHCEGAWDGSRKYVSIESQPESTNKVTEGKELKDISDEDLLDISEMFLGIKMNYGYKLDCLAKKDESIKLILNSKESISMLRIYQYLQSKGYKLPVYFSQLDNKKQVEDEILIGLPDGVELSPEKMERIKEFIKNNSLPIVDIGETTEKYVGDLVDKDGFVEVVGFGKVHINNMQLVFPIKWRQ